MQQFRILGSCVRQSSVTHQEEGEVRYDTASTGHLRQWFQRKGQDNVGRDFPMLETEGNKRERNMAGPLLFTLWSAHPPEPKCSHLESVICLGKGHSVFPVLVMINNDCQLRKI